MRLSSASASVEAMLSSSVMASLPGQPSRSSALGPWKEHVPRIREVRRQLWAMAREHGAELVVAHPGEAGWRVDLGREVLGVEPVALEAPRRHQDEDAEGRVREAEARRRAVLAAALDERADQEVDLVDRA